MVHGCCGSFPRFVASIYVQFFEFLKRAYNALKAFDGVNFIFYAENVTESAKVAKYSKKSAFCMRIIWRCESFLLILCNKITMQ